MKALTVVAIAVLAAATAPAQEQQQQQKPSTSTSTTTTQSSTTTTTTPSAAERQSIWMKSKAKNWQTEHQTWEQRGGYTAYRVPQDKFSTSFGQDRVFRINSLPYRDVNGRPYYQYNGYWMTIVDPWPETWPSGWYDSDEVYVRMGDGGYYLYNTRYANQGLALEFESPSTQTPTIPSGGSR